MVKKIPTRNGAGNPDFTYNDLKRAGIRFNNKNVIEIEYYSDSEDLTITKTDELTETVKTIVTNFDNPGGGGGLTMDDVAEKNFTGDVVLTTATTIKFGAFAESDITSITGDSPTKIETEAFRHCNTIISAVFPNVTTVTSANYAFANCANLEILKLPKLTSLSSTTYLCANSPKLKIVDLGVVNSLVNYCFQNDTALRTLILRKSDSICTTSWASAAVFGGIYNNPDESEIYVPQNLVSTYEQATNWSVLYTMGVTFKAIEGSIYE